MRRFEIFELEELRKKLPFYDEDLPTTEAVLFIIVTAGRLHTFLRLSIAYIYRYYLMYYTRKVDHSPSKTMKMFDKCLGDIVVFVAIWSKIN